MADRQLFRLEFPGFSLVVALSLPPFFSPLGFLDKSHRLVHGEGMTKKSMSVAEAGRRGGRTTLKRYGRKQLRAWGKLGGRPKKKKVKK